MVQSVCEIGLVEFDNSRDFYPTCGNEEPACGFGIGYIIYPEYLADTCLTYSELEDYGKGKALYTWEISNLKIYDTPRELGEFLSCKYYNGNECTLDRSFVCPYQKPDWNPDGSINIFDCEKRLTHPPQSWCYVEEVEE